MKYTVIAIVLTVLACSSAFSGEDFECRDKVVKAQVDYAVQIYGETVGDDDFYQFTQEFHFPLKCHTPDMNSHFGITNYIVYIDDVAFGSRLAVINNGGLYELNSSIFSFGGIFDENARESQVQLPISLDNMIPRLYQEQELFYKGIRYQYSLRTSKIEIRDQE